MDSLGRFAGLVADLRDGRSGTLSIGSFASAGEAWIPHVAKVLAVELPDVILSLDIDYHPGDNRLTYDIEISAEHPHQTPQTPTGMRRHVLLDEPFVLLVPEQHRLAGARTVALGDLGDERWIDDDPHDTSCGQLVRSMGGTPPGSTPAPSPAPATTTRASPSSPPAWASRWCRAWPSVRPPTVRMVRVVDPEPMRRIVAFVREDADAKPVVSRAMEVLRETACAIAPC